MPSSEYTTTGGGLKLKGAKNAGVDKKKKKKKPSASADKPVEDAAETGPSSTKLDLQNALRDEDDEDEKAATANEDIVTTQTPRDAPTFAKTEAERKYDERRRKRLDERLKKEGVKTHKERVEELNKYLSGLSEHHDMPRIGPG